tara:strand:- start:1421 stop:1990 length:570 start_codon:yes stop_codon:yes gene_type:complete
MPFWTDSTGQDPKRNYRFLVTIGNMPDGATWYAKSVTKPAFEITNAEHAFLNHTFYYPGRVTWQPVEVVLVDPVSPDALANILSIIQGSGYKPPANFTETTTISKSSAVSSLGGVVIQVIQADGSILENWTLNGAFITNVSYDGLAYEDDGISTITLSFRYDWADCVTANPATGVSGGPANDFFKLNPA